MEAVNSEPRWHKYGLRSDPFFSGALLPDEAGGRPIHLFRGREMERTALEQRIRDGVASASAVIAEGGYGKTSLTSRVAHDLRQQYLILPDELAFDHDAPTSSFFFDVLDGIVRGLLDRGVQLPKPPRNPMDDPKQPYPALLEAVRLVALYRQSNGLQLGAQLGPFIVQTGGGQLVQPRYHPRHSRELLRGVVRDLRDLTNVQGIIVRMNNLDEPFITGREDRVLEFLNEARDLFQEDGCHYLLCGNRDLAEMLSGNNRVSTVFGPHTHLADFTARDIHGILTARYEHLADDGYTPPAEPGLVDALHDIHHGDLRNILKDLRHAMELAQPVAGEPVTLDAALPLLEDHHLGALNNLRPHDWRLLDTLLGQGPLRQADLAKASGLTPGRISQIVTPLRQREAVEECGGPEAGTYLRLTGSSRMAQNARHRG